GVRNVFWNVRHTELAPTTSFRTRIVVGACAQLSYLVPRQIVVCAERALEAHVTLGYCADRFTVIPNGYDLAMYAPRPEAGRVTRESLGLPQDGPLVGLVARWTPEKDHASLLTALAIARRSLPTLQLIL